MKQRFDEVMSQNAYLRKQLNKSMKQKQRILESPTGSNPLKERPSQGGLHEGSGMHLTTLMTLELNFQSSKESLTPMNFWSGYILLREPLSTKMYQKIKKWSWWPWGYANMPQYGGLIFVIKGLEKESQRFRCGRKMKTKLKARFLPSSYIQDSYS